MPRKSGKSRAPIREPLSPRASRLAWALAVGGGVLMALPFLFDAAEWLAPLAPVPWILAFELFPGRAFLRGYVGGWAWLFLGLTWLDHVAVPATVLCASYFALYVGAFWWMAVRMRHRAGVPAYLAAPLALVAGELLAEHVTVFNVTWLFPGHAAWRFPALMQAAEWGGISVVGALLMLVAGALAHAGLAVARSRAALLRAGTWRPALVAAAFAAVVVTAGALRLRSLELQAGPAVALVQGNVPQTIRVDPSRAPEVLAKHLRLTETAKDGTFDLVAWPETTAATCLEEDDAAREAIAATARVVGRPILVGAIGENDEPVPPCNSAFLVTPDGRLQARCDKRVLVPGAETLLLIDHVEPLRRVIGDWLSTHMHFRPFLTPGTRPVVMRAGSLLFGAEICYDDLVPRPSWELRRAGAEALVVVSNEAWFGERELDQHLAMATVRCIETRLPMARATNDGLTCIVDPAGRVTQSLPRAQDGVLIGSLATTAARPVPAAVRLAVRGALSLAAAVLAWSPGSSRGAP